MLMSFILGCGTPSNKQTYNYAISDIVQNNWDSAIKNLDATIKKSPDHERAYNSRILKSMIYLALAKNAKYEYEIYKDFSILIPENKTLTPLVKAKENLRRRYLTSLDNEIKQIMKLHKNYKTPEFDLTEYKIMPYDPTQVTQDFFSKNYNPQHINDLTAKHANYAFASYFLVCTGQKGKVLDRPLKGNLNLPVYFSLLSKLMTKEKDKQLLNTGQELDKLVLSMTGKKVSTVINEFNQ
jgi:hypothetical protein